MTARRDILVIGYGNPSRGDDAAGAALVARLEALRDAGQLADCFDTRVAVQLQIEHAVDLNGRRLVIFTDAASNLPDGFEVLEVGAERDRSYTSHALSPGALLEVQQRAFGEHPQRCLLVAIPGDDFGLDRPMTDRTRRETERASHCVARLIAESSTNG